MRGASFCTHTAWCCWIIGLILVLGQSRFADSKPTNPSVNFEVCYNISKRMVNAVMDTLVHLQNLNRDFNCSYTSVDLQYHAQSEMNTLRACLPQTCICSNITKLVTDEDQCLMAIHSDIKTFKGKLQGVKLNRPPLNKVIEEMLETLKRYNDGKSEKKESCSQFNCNFKQCTAILKFQQRAVTISRIFSYFRNEALKQHDH